MRILDLGEMFGYPTAKILYPWHPTQVEVKSLNEADKVLPMVDLVMFGGGQDIHTSFYKHSNVASQCGRRPSKRDLFEREIFFMCKELKIPMLGICRGAQFLCAMSGGALIQDCLNHSISSYHPILTSSGVKMLMTSTHHQMMYPFETHHELIAWAEDLSHGRFEYDHHSMCLKLNHEGVLEKEPEIVYFPDTNALAVQGHPEYFQDVYAPPVQFVRDLISNRLFKEERNNRG